MLEADLRHADADPNRDVFNAKIWSHNAVLVTIPGWPFSLIHDRDSLSKELDRCVRDGLDDVLHKYTEPDQTYLRETKSYLLQFEEDDELSVKKFSSLHL